MKPYVLSLCVGVLIGVIYSLLNVRSPAPPVIALVGLLGILVGEHIVPVGKQILAGVSFRLACQQTESFTRILGIPSNPSTKIERDKTS